ncbi:MAG: PQQ-dependent sugar dehydrogenase [Planctomycetia bacterium]|nr:PQQ-dependent sugar dehydrogenase [Planctomycetia bacterium]
MVRLRPLRWIERVSPSIAIVLSLAGGAKAVIPSGATIRLESFATIPPSLGQPDLLTSAGDGSSRAFVVGQAGEVSLIKDGVRSTFLNLADAGVTVLGSSTLGDERGLLGLAFHPDFAAPEGTPGRGKVYTFESEPRAGAADFDHPELVPDGLGDHFSVVREWTVSAANPDVIDTSIPSRVLMTINKPQSKHNAGGLVFGPDKNLYIPVGDGGGVNDNAGFLENPLDGHTNDIGNGQDITNVYGKILRIDPLGTGSANGQYGIPATNPFVGDTPGVDEIFAYGLRNPFRISFDSATGALYAGDVGQSAREEVDIITAGGNYGWVYMEGTRVNRFGGPAGMIPPIAEYTHEDGHAVMGGFVYHGSLLAPLVGHYIFGDYAGPGFASGRLFYLDDENQVKGFALAPDGLGISGRLTGYGQDEKGELYALFSDGQVMRLSRNPGDVDLSGVVDVSDVQLVAADYLTHGPLADANLDGLVDVSDIQLIAFHWLEGGGSPASAVPEPSSLGLTACAIGVLALRMARRRAPRQLPQ